MVMVGCVTLSGFVGRGSRVSWRGFEFWGGCSKLVILGGRTCVFVRTRELAAKTTRSLKWKGGVFY
jgi:hypothetical protein